MMSQSQNDKHTQLNTGSGFFYIIPFLLISATEVLSQFSAISAQGYVVINVAIPIYATPDQIGLGVGTTMLGSTIIISPYDGLAWRFEVCGQAGSSYNISFPLSAILYRTVSGVPYFGPNNELTFSRGSVTVNRYNTSRNQAIAFIPAGVLSGTATFLTGFSNPQYVYHWVGGTITIPFSNVTGYYAGSYAITVNYVGI